MRGETVKGESAKGAPVVRWQMITSNADEAARFYGAVFGWSERRENALAYREVNTGSAAGIQGGIWPAPAGTPAMIQLFVEVGDIDATIESVTQNGGSILVPKCALPDGDVMAVVRDPGGISVGLVLARPRA